MKYCKYCELVVGNKDSEKYCPYCGNVLLADIKYKTDCGHEANYNDKYCRDCSKRLIN
jgi:hypothetical protein